MEIAVVIVDDDEVDRMITRKRFERSDYAEVFTTFREVENGDAFLENVRKDGSLWGDQVLVLMDVNMPGRSGFETISELQTLIERGEVTDGGVVMIFTSSENSTDMMRAKAASLVTDYLIKPLTEQDISRVFNMFASMRRDGFQQRAV